MTILWVSHFIPYPPKGGAFQRSYHLLKRVGAAHDLHLLAMRHKSATHPAAEMQGARDALLQFCRTVEFVDMASATEGLGVLVRALRCVLTGVPLSAGMFRSAAVHALVRRLIEVHRVDVLHIDTISVADYLDDAGGVPTLMAHMGAEAFMVRRRIPRERSLPRRWFFALEARHLARYEAARCAQADLNVVVSDLDRRLMMETAPDARYVVVENGVDVGYFTPVPPTQGRRLVFAGRLDQYSNRDAILHFMTSAWPALTAAHPDISIDIIGLNPPPALVDLAATDPRVRVHGFVPDIRPFFREATIAICPIRDGGGTRVKILDNLAQGMPIVSTSIGCEGIDVVDGRDALLADTPEAFVSHISTLFADDALRHRLQANARRLAEEVYDWDPIAAKLIGHYEALAAGRTRRG